MQIKLTRLFGEMVFQSFSQVEVDSICEVVGRERQWIDRQPSFFAVRVDAAGQGKLAAAGYQIEVPQEEEQATAARIPVPRKAVSALSRDEQREFDAIRREIGKFEADNDNDSGMGLHYPPDLKRKMRRLDELAAKLPKATDWRTEAYSEAEDIMSLRGPRSANAFLANNGLDPQY